MAAGKDPIYEEEYNCLTTDLDGNGFPPTTVNSQAVPEGAKMYVWDNSTKKLSKIFKMVFGGWMQL